MPYFKPIQSLSRKRLLIAFALVSVVLAVALPWIFSSKVAVTIGVQGHHQVTVTGEPYSAVPYTHGDPLAVRISSSVPVAEGIRYDISYMAYGPGEHNLGDYLIDEQGQQASDLPGMKVSVDALLPDDYSGILFETESTPINLHSYYRPVMALLWGLWLLLVIPLSMYGRTNRKVVVEAVPPPSVSERLRQLLETAEQKSLSVEQQADLEKLLLNLWTDRLNLSSKRLVDTVEQLRQHPSAGLQLAAVEQWLHTRETPFNGSVARNLLIELGWRNEDMKQELTTE